MSKLSVEEIKRASHGLRGSIPEELATPVDHFGEESIQLLKFHGVYQQDDRDARKSDRETGAGRDYSCMIRTKCPGGFLPAEFYLAVDQLTELFGNGTIRVTTRGALQLHGVRKSNLHEVIHQINEHLGSTLAACGDVNRNVMATPYPLRRPDYDAAHAAAFAIADAAHAAHASLLRDLARRRTRALDQARRSTNRSTAPRICRASSRSRSRCRATTRSTSTRTTSASSRSTLATGPLEGYNLTVGGGLGMTHGKHATFPRLADEFAFVPPERLIAAVQAIVIVQRDYGDRTNRKHARLKYTIEDRGIDWFRGAVEAQAGFTLGRWRELPAWTRSRIPGLGRARRRQVVLRAGNHERTYCRSRHGEAQDRACARSSRKPGAISSRRPIQSLLIVDVDAAQRATIDAILQAHGVANDADEFERKALACPALPTCGLALAEAERFLPELLDGLREAWYGAGLGEGVPTIRMTGCPNSCARPVHRRDRDRRHEPQYATSFRSAATPDRRASTRYTAKRCAANEIARRLAELFAAYAADRRRAKRSVTSASTPSPHSSNVGVSASASPPVP